MTDEESDEKLDILYQEVQQTINKQHQEILETDKKAGKILRINILTFGAVLTALSILIRFSRSADTPIVNSLLGPVPLILFSSGLITLGASAIIAAITYSASPIRIGIGGRDLQWIFESGIDSKERIKPDLLAGYSTWIRLNEFPVSTNHFRLTLTMLLAAVSIAFMGLGLLYGLTPIPSDNQLLSAGKLFITIFIAIALVAFVYESSEIRSIRGYTTKKRSEARNAAIEYGKLLEDGEVEHIFGGTTIRGGTTEDQPSDLRKAARRGMKLEEWVYENAATIVPDVSEIRKEFSLDGDHKFIFDVIGDRDDCIVIFEAKLKVRREPIKHEYNRLKQAEDLLGEDAEMYVVSYSYQRDALEFIKQNDSLHAVLINEERVDRELDGISKQR